MKKNIEELIYVETEKRLDIMASDNYEYPKKVNKVDFLLIIIMILISILFIILCMTGVIM